jgi:hypothetical protein
MSTEPQAPATAPAPAAATAPPAAPAAAPTGAKPLNQQEAKTEPNALAAAIGGAWDKFKQGKLLSYSTMALLLVLTAGIGVTVWILGERRKAESGRWVALDGTFSGGGTRGLEEFASANPNTKQARLASLEIARSQLGPEGIDRLYVLAPDFRSAFGDADAKAREARATAIKNIETARESFAKLADDFKTDKVLKVQCLMALAKAEAALVGVPKEGKLDEFRGDPKKAIELLDQLAAEAGDTAWGKDAKKLADALRNANTADQVKALQAGLYEVKPTLPDLGPIAPKL